LENKFYITTPIYYVNDIPHAGHAYTTIAADVLARYNRLLGKKVFFLTGIDEHGAKIAEAAAKKEMSPQEFVDGLSARFKEAWKVINSSHNEFIRTTDTRHKEVVKEVVESLITNGYVEKRKYEGLYCISCEKFYSKDELINNLCPDHKRECVIHSEENYFFLLSKIASKFNILEKIEKDEIKIRPLSRKNEIVGKVKNGLEDISISRQAVDWGIDFPGDQSQTIYVWIDALINYYSATKIYKEGPSWPADIHLMAKEILWFHSVIWPALLLAINKELPKKIFAHGFFTIDGQKMSKTIGNVLDPLKLIDKFGPDALRYALLREFPFGEDGDISEEKILGRYNNLASGFGNLVSRVLTMIEKYNQGLIPDPKEKTGLSCVENFADPKHSCDIFWSHYHDYLEELEFDKILKEFELLVDYSNRYIENSKPWLLAKDDKGECLDTILFNLAENIRHLAIAIYPFMPNTANIIMLSLALEEIDENNFNLDKEKIWGGVKPGSKTEKIKQLFPRLDF
jgi:methionyl-tRNA synthetase